MPPRFRTPDHLKDPSLCPQFRDDILTRVNYDFGSPENVPTEPVACPVLKGSVACGKLIQFTAIQAEGMCHIANAQAVIEDSSEKGEGCFRQNDRAKQDYFPGVFKTYFG